jgi:transposase
VAELEAEAGRHSGNSSKPPSGGTLAQHQAQKARRQGWTSKGKPKRPKGKQPGAPGAHLARVAHPDVVVPHPPTVCSSCGASLADAEVVATETRQVFDIPTPTIVVTAHVVERLRCACGCLSAGEFPAETTAPAVFGPVVSGVGSYLLAYQHLPVARTAEALADLVGMEVSTGWVSGLLPKAKGLLEHFLVDLRYRLMASPVMANDETGCPHRRRAVLVPRRHHRDPRPAHLPPPPGPPEDGGCRCASRLPGDLGARPLCPVLAVPLRALGLPCPPHSRPGRGGRAGFPAALGRGHGETAALRQGQGRQGPGGRAGLAVEAPAPPHRRGLRRPRRPGGPTPTPGCWAGRNEPGPSGSPSTWRWPSRK